MNRVRVRVERSSGTAGSQVRAGRGRAGGGSGGGMDDGNKRVRRISVGPCLNVTKVDGSGREMINQVNHVSWYTIVP